MGISYTHTIINRIPFLNMEETKTLHHLRQLIKATPPTERSRHFDLSEFTSLLKSLLHEQIDSKIVRMAAAAEGATLIRGVDGTPDFLTFEPSSILAAEKPNPDHLQQKLDEAKVARQQEYDDHVAHIKQLNDQRKALFLAVAMGDQAFVAIASVDTSIAESQFYIDEYACITEAFCEVENKIAELKEAAELG